MNKSLPYVELVCRSYYSFLQGASSPAQLLEQAQIHGYQGLVISDLNGFYGSIQGYNAIQDFKFLNTPSHIPVTPDLFYSNGVEIILNGYHYVIIPKNIKGYQALCHKLSLMHHQKDLWKDPISQQSEKDFFSHIEEWIVLALPPWNLTATEHLKNLYSDFYLAIYRNYTKESFHYNMLAFNLEKNNGYSLVACQRVLFAVPDHSSIFHALMAIKKRQPLSAINRLSNQEHYLKSLTFLEKMWSDRPDLLEKTTQIAQKITFRWTQIQYSYPSFPVPYPFTPIQWLRHLCLQNIPKRLSFQDFDQYQSQFEKELSLIAELKYEDYFLTIYEIIDFAQKRNILFQGRGSAANSIVCYLLGITSVHPRQIQMLFERFISRERHEPPDIDIDFDAERREEIIQFLFSRYGTNHVAQVSHTVHFKSKSALRETALILEIPETCIKKVQTHLSRRPLEVNQSLEEITKNFISKEVLLQWITLAKQVIGIPRHLGLHSSGFIISRTPLIDLVPIEKATREGRYMIQWNKDDLETLKMMKIDILGLGMLNALNKAFTLLREHKKIPLGLYSAPPDDPKTYQMIQKAQTIGVFQIESRAQMAMLPRIKPGNFYDLAIQIAMVRPGPIEGGLVEPFLKNRNSPQNINYPKPELAPILNRTFGVPIFQEQLMQLMMIAAGFTPGEADQMRRLLGQSQKDPDKMERLNQRIIQGMKSQNIPEPFIQTILKTIKGFSAYGFPESHAASFAHIAYISSYLKCHHPEVFVCSLLNAQPMGFYHPRTLIHEAKRQGVVFLPLHLLRSQWEFTLEALSHQTLWGVREGFLQIKGLHRNTVHEIQRIRCYLPDSPSPLLNPLSYFKEIIKRIIVQTTISSSQIKLLIYSGAFSFTTVSTQQMIWCLGEYLSYRTQSLFYLIKEGLPTSSRLPPPPHPQQERWDYRLKGYSLDKHPVKWIKEKLTIIDLSLLNDSESLKNQPQHQVTSLLGMISSNQRPPTANGVCFLTLEDEKGLCNVILWPHIYQKYAILIEESPFIIVTGRLQKQWGTIHLIGEHLVAVNP
ncbi:MAG: error-prone DNA polymerase [Bdellovibrionaceae bacterium]|nr:error-prone DNA polymerase [Pseudobdellovibrionaceae bacterium]